MLIEPDGHLYPAQRIRVHPFNRQFDKLFAIPPGQIGTGSPPPQMTYMGIYLDSLGCRTIVHERHYIDRHFIDDFSLFYSRSLRNYPNSCQRLHFFASEFGEPRWSGLVQRANGGGREEVERELARQYLGFMVIKPLPGSPIGRTVIRTFDHTTPSGRRRDFSAIRRYEVSLAGLSLSVEGLAFQQQDQGVSACATTALWSALQRTAPREHLSSPTPAQITEAASRYMLPEGRALPSEGLRFDQLCEAVRATGLAPVLLTSISPPEDRAHMATYLRSGLPVLLGILPMEGGEAHAVCLVGLRWGAVHPPTNPHISYRDGSTAVEGVYVHDDRLGPYASAPLKPTTINGDVVTTLELSWPDEQPVEESRLLGMLIPVPVKLRLSAVRLRALAHAVAQTFAVGIPALAGLEVHTSFCKGASYRAKAYNFNLSLQGLREFTHETILSRYIGLIELVTDDGPVADVILDATETIPNPSVLAVVRREAAPPACGRQIRIIAKVLGAKGIT